MLRRRRAACLTPRDFGVASSSINVACTAQVVNAASSIPDGLNLHGIRFNPIPRDTGIGERGARLRRGINYRDAVRVIAERIARTSLANVYRSQHPICLGYRVSQLFCSFIALFLLSVRLICKV